ncbi:hypothetical protein [Erythrobacter sp.]|uniref:hypothetical protein n=1 Tax=Erythrobacter sp. TaxID=1042 RepID=UPI002ED10F40
MAILRLSACASLAFAPPIGSTLAAQDLGVPAERITRAATLGEGEGVVVLSVRSELYLEEPLDLYFALESAGDENGTDAIVRVERRQGAFAFGNDTVEYRPRGYRLPAGSYRLLAHGIDCAKVPAPDERCLIERRGIIGRIEISRPSRGYGEDAPRFEVREGAVTYAGDFALTARNSVEWSPVPAEELAKLRRRFAGLEAGPAPEIPEGFRLKYGLRARSFQDDRGRRY